MQFVSKGARRTKTVAFFFPEGPSLGNDTAPNMKFVSLITTCCDTKVVIKWIKRLFHLPNLECS